MNPLVVVRPMGAVNWYEHLGGCAPYGGYELDVTDTQDSDGRAPKEATDGESTWIVKKKKTRK